MSVSEVAAPSERRFDRPDVLIAVLVAVVAFAARFATVYSRGSITAGAGYDPAVYYASADALVHGLVPYRDYVLLHPPGSSLLLAPAALIGRLTTDSIGFDIATILSMLAGSVNAVLVVRIVRRMGLSRSAAAVGGLMYAVLEISVRSELYGRLEVWGNLFLLLGLLGYVSSVRTGSGRASALSGAALAVAASVKIVYAVPLLVVLLWHLVDRHDRGRVLRWIGGCVAAAVCIDGPFLILAGRSMISMVVVDQTMRAGQTSPGLFKRAADLAQSTALLPHGPHLAWAAVAALSAVVGAAIVLLASSVPAGRLPTALLLAQLGALLVAPTYFPYYGDFLVPALCLAAGAATHAFQLRFRLPTRSVAALGAAAVAAAAIPLVRVELINTPADTLAVPVNITLADPGNAMVREATAVRCLQATTPMPLILLNALSRDFQNGCPQWVDVSGRTYSIDRGSHYVDRSVNQRWQRDILAYLLAGQQYVLVDTVREGLDSRTMAVLRQGPVVGRSPSFVLQRRVPQQAAPATAGASAAGRTAGR